MHVLLLRAVLGADDGRGQLLSLMCRWCVAGVGVLEEYRQRATVPAVRGARREGASHGARGRVIAAICVS